MASKDDDAADGFLKYVVLVIFGWIIVFPFGVMKLLETEFLSDIFVSLRYDELFIKPILVSLGIEISTRVAHFLIGIIVAGGAFGAAMNLVPFGCICLLGGITATGYIERMRYVFSDIVPFHAIVSKLIVPMLKAPTLIVPMLKAPTPIVPPVKIPT